MAQKFEIFNNRQTYSVNLPVVNENGCYEIRLESIGGLGANLCGKLLGELGAGYLNLNASAFSSYGSEKRGSPVKSYVRWSAPDQEILHNSPVERPHMLVLFHHALSKTLPVTAGVDENCTLVVNTDKTPEGIREELRLYAGNVCCINALELALKSKSRINMVILGAVAKASGFIPIDAVKKLVSDTLGKKYPDALKANLDGMKRGYEEVRKIRIGSVNGKEPEKEYSTQTEWGYENAPIGGINPRLGSTVIADLAPSRQGYIPLFIKERCINCGLCHSACPDMVFQFKHGEYKGREMMVNQGLDYYHCKGCLRCVDVCPVNALVRGVESEHPDKDYFMPNQELLRMPEYYEESGPDGYITSESYLTEKRMEGGEV